MNDDLLTKTSLADFLKVKPQTIDVFKRSGLPVAVRSGKRELFDPDECLKWVEDNIAEEEPEEPEEEPTKSDEDDPLYQAKLRRILLDCRLKEMEIERRAELVIDASAVEAYETRIFANINAKLNALPGRVAPSLVSISDAGIISAKLQKEIAKVQLALQEGEFFSEQDDPSEIT